MEEIFAALLEGLVELFAEVVLQVLFELVAEALREGFRGRRTYGPWVSIAGTILMGGVAGLLSVLIFPHRLIHTRVLIPGLSLVLAPLVAGYVMSLVGDLLRKLGRQPSSLATFRGGSIFAFAMALVRLAFIGLVS
ncbi:MAG: hypothetical protein ABI823_07220 [Bryobacteraceae bacterium]